MRGWRRIIYLLSAMFCLLPFSLSAEPLDDPASAVFEVSVNASVYQDSAPWNTTARWRVGTGFSLQTHQGKRILTTAELVQGATYITVRPDNSPQTFEAEVEYVSHEIDVAILNPVDESLLENRETLVLGDLPQPEQSVSLYGYPLGGEALSVTQGIVSRIEYYTYPYSDLSFQAIQVDAAANAGNPGSPALVDGKVVGMLFDFDESLENAGYLVPVSYIRQLLNDLQDGTLDGIPELWLDYQFVINPVQKKYLRMTPEQTGILVNKLCSHTDTALVLNEGDVITAIDGKPVTYNDFIQANGKQFSHFREHIDLHQVDDVVTVELLSSGYTEKWNVRLNQRSQTTNVLESPPRYFIFGGFVFLASRKEPVCESVGDDETGVAAAEKDEVKLVRVLPSSSGTAGFSDAESMTISTVNGESYDTFEDFYSKLTQGDEKSIILKDDANYQIVIDRQLAESEEESLLERYGITRPQSAEVDEWSGDD